MTVAGISRALVLMLFVVGTFFGGAALLRSSAQACGGGVIWTVPSGNYPADSQGIVDSPLSFSITFPSCIATAVIYWTLTDLTTQTVVQSNAQVAGNVNSYGFPSALYV